MERQKNERYIENYINQLNEKVHHPILKRDTDQFELDAEKAFFLLLPLLNGEKWTDQMNQSAIAVGAVHIAFDAHDAIDMTSATSRKQQLTVLAGDYYSGIHYKLLADTKDFSFIRLLSKQIGRINEVKTVFHGRAPANAKQLIDAVQTIESGCITEFLYAFGFSRYAPLAKAILPLIHLETDLVRKSSFKKPLQDVLGWEQSELHLEQAIQELKIDIDNAMEKAVFLTPLVKVEIRSMVKPLLGKLI
ncbi:heptaprenyl diphosphate synthase component 1 [Sporosarcina sp. CAU 1771]